MPDPALLPPNTALGVDDPSPPATSAKANAGLLWGLIPVIVGAALEILGEADVLFPGASSGVKTTIAIVVMFLGPVASYFGVYRTPNRLKQPVVVDPQPVAP